MKNKYFVYILLFISLLGLSGCGIRQKSWLSNLSSGMNKKQVKSKMGQPDFVHTPTTNIKGETIDIWEYELATTDENQWSKQFAASFSLTLMSLTLGFIPGFPRELYALTIPISYAPLIFMDSPYDYNTYFLKFVNDFLSKWGSASDVGLDKKFIS